MHTLIEEEEEEEVSQKDQGISGDTVSTCIVHKMNEKIESYTEPYTKPLEEGNGVAEGKNERKIACWMDNDGEWDESRREANAKLKARTLHGLNGG